MPEQTIAEIDARYELIHQTSIKYDSIVLKIADVSKAIEKLNVKYPRDGYFHFTQDVEMLLDVLVETMAVPSKYYKNQRLFSALSTIPKGDIVNALKLAYGRHVKRDCDYGSTRMGGRESRIDAIIKKLRTAWELIFKNWTQFGWNGFLMACEEIEANYARSTVLKALKTLIQGEK